MCRQNKLCPKLISKEKCFRVERYDQRAMVEVFHEHIPLHRISQEVEIEALHTLVGHFEGWSGTYILHLLLNKRRGGPECWPGFIGHIEYPEPGVIRRYFSSKNTTAWTDTIVSTGSFRRKAEAE
jgi:hypothetical protein